MEADDGLTAQVLRIDALLRPRDVAPSGIESGAHVAQLARDQRWIVDGAYADREFWPPFSEFDAPGAAHDIEQEPRLLATQGFQM